MSKRSDDTNLLAIAERLRLTRAATGLTQAAMGRLVGIASNAWNNNERGRDRISVDQAIKLCIATGVTLDWIYRGEMKGLPHDITIKIQAIARQESEERRRA